MVSEDSKSESKEPSSSFGLSNGSTPMIHVSKDVLEEFICTIPQQSGGKDALKSMGETESMMEEDSFVTKSIPSENSTDNLINTNGVKSADNLNENVDHVKKGEISSQVSDGLSDKSKNSSSQSLSSNRDLSTSSEKPSLQTKFESSSPDSSKTGSTSNGVLSPFENQNASVIKSSETVTESGSSSDIFATEDEHSSKKLASPGNNEKSTEDLTLPKKDVLRESPREEDHIDPQPGSPLSGSLSGISLEETLLRDEINDDDQDTDDFSEERLLRGSESENEESSSRDDFSDGSHSPHLDNVVKVEEEIDPIISDNKNDKSPGSGVFQESDSSCASKTQDSNSSQQKSPENPAVEDDLAKDSASLEGAMSSRVQSPDKVSPINVNGVSDDLPAINESLPDLQLDAFSNKKISPAESEDESMSIFPDPKISRNSSEKNSDAEQDVPQATPVEDNLTDSQLLKTTVQQNISDQVEPMDCKGAQEMLPTSEIPSLSDVEAPTSPNQGKKRPLSAAENSNSSKPDLKKIRVFKEKTNSSSKADAIQKTTKTSEEGLIEISKNMESLKTLKSRLQEEKALQKKSSGEKVVTNDELISKEELERRAAQEMRSANLNNNKLRRIKRKDLEGLVIELFVDKVLHEHQLGQQKDLCKRLEATLETNRKKAAQFHKEVDDLKKVTQRLQAEHVARKNQVIGPVRVKRSVGIQATPTIISKGIMQATTGNATFNARIVTPSLPSMNPVTPTPESTKEPKTIQASQVSFSEPLLISPVQAKAVVSHQNPPTSSHKNIHYPSPAQLTTNSVVPVKNIVKASSFATTCMVTNTPGSVPTCQPSPVAPPQMVVVNSMVMQRPQNSIQGGASVGAPILSPGNTRLIRAPLSSIAPLAPLPSSPVTPAGVVNPPRATASSGVIDLTDDDEGSKSSRQQVAAGSVLTFQKTPNVGLSTNTSGQYVALKPPSSMGQLVLVPTSPGQPAPTLVVGGNITNNSAPMSTIGATTVTPRVFPTTTARLPSTTNLVNTPRLVVGTRMDGNFIATLPRHPAALPNAPPQQTMGYSKKPPPMPILKLSQKDNSIVLSWNMAKTDEHEKISSYQLYAYQEGLTPPSPDLWKKVGSVKALELPMACTLTRFMPGHVYHFAVRALDIRSRLGPFSEPRSVRLGAKTT